MDKQKEIQKMQQEIFDSCAWRFSRHPEDYREVANDIGEDLYNLGYRNCKDKVVLTREEYEKFRRIENTIKRFSTVSPTEAESENKALKEEIAIVLAQKRNIWNSYNQLKQDMEWQIDKQVEEELDRVEKEARKETAREILYKLKDIIVKYRGVGCGVHPLMFDLYELEKQYGVEIEEE